MCSFYLKVASHSMRWKLYLIMCFYGMLHLNVVFGGVSGHNDNYCDDLVAGSDEFHSSACSGLTTLPSFFKCKGTPLIKQQIYTSRVDDFVCDCCDGSDEMRPDVICENRCAALEESERSRLEAKRNVQFKGGLLRAAAVAEAQKELAELKQAAIVEKGRVPELDAIIEQAETSAKTAKIIAAAKLQDRVEESKVIYNSHVQRVFGSTSRPVLERLLSALVLRGKEEVGAAVLQASKGRYLSAGEDPDDAQTLLLALETTADNDVSVGLYTMQAGKLQPPGPGHKYDVMHLRDYVRLSADSISLMTEALALARLDQAGLLHALSTALIEATPLRTLVVSLVDAGFVDLSTNTDSELHQAVELAAQFPPTPKEIQEAPESERDLQLEGLERAAEEARKEKSKLKERSKASEEALRFDYGADDYLFALYGKCGTTYDKAYRYSVCPFRQAQQDQTSVGSYEKVEIRTNAQTLDPELWMLFTRGAYCHATRRPREMHVRLECSDSDRLTLSGVSEYDVCVYQGVLHTPLACESVTNSVLNGRSEL